MYTFSNPLHALPIVCAIVYVLAIKSTSGVYDYVYEHISRGGNQLILLEMIKRLLS